MRSGRRAREVVALAALAAASLGAFYEWGGAAGRGVRELEKKEHQRAVASLREGREELPRSAAVRYDQALAFEGAGLLDSARTAYRDAAESPELKGDKARSSAAYNRGNLAMRAQDYAAAARHYRHSLRIDPTRADAKKNLEEAIRRVRRLRQEPQSGRGTPAPRSQGQESQRGGQSATPRSDPEREQRESPPSAERQPQSGLGTTTPSRAEAEHWLDALESERKAARQRDRGGPEDERGQRDW